jgi:hypothetical protein
MKNILNIEISAIKEIVLNVLDYPQGIKDIGFEEDNTILVLSNTAMHFDEINIYELANKCKQYATFYNYAIESIVYEEGTSVSVWDNSYIQIFYNLDNVETEPEAIFKACEWVISNLKDKK